MADIVLNRLQFVKHDEVFATRDEAYEYVISNQTIERPSLLAEPMVLLYESGSATKGPNVILAIGSVGSGTTSTANRTFFIDTQKTEDEIEELREIIEEAIKSLSLIPLESDTLDLKAEKTDDGTIISGDVKIADYRIVSGKVEENIIVTEGNKGIYAFADMEYDPETFTITFKTTKATKQFQLPPDQHVVKGWYSTDDEAIYLKLADNSKVKIDVVKLIDEWTVLSGASSTPICLYKQHVSSSTEAHDGLYDWQDILTADVRVADHIDDNIIHKDRTGRYLYVKGTADNIQYKNGQTVADALDNVDTKVSTSAGNLINKRPDGIYAYAMLDYKQAENKIVYKYSTGEGEVEEISFQLNSVKLLEDITYDPVNEAIVIRYIDAQGEYQRVVIPVKDIIEEWIVNNEGHNIELNKYRSEGQGKDILSADAKIYNGDNNILEDKNHMLYVNGIADNIKYDATGETTVKGEIDALKGGSEELNEKIEAETARAEAAEQALGAKIDQEIADREADVDEEQARAEEAEEILTNKIGSGFTDDPHENVTSKFNELTDKVNTEADKLQAETERSEAKDTEHDGRLDAIDAEIGDGFGPRNTVRDEINNLQSEIDAVSADSASSIKDVINNDHSINVDKTDATKPVISVNLSEEVEDNKPNIIKLNNDGLYAGVDLSYNKDDNKLTFKTTNGSKEIQLESMSSIISIEYNPSKEAIVITYMTNGHEIKTVEIPVGDLINEWRVEDGHPHAVQLEKVRVASGSSEQDVLKASVVITEDHDDNILVMDGGTLYVPANTDATAALSGAIETEKNERIEGDRALEDLVQAETTRAQLAESALSAFTITATNEEKTRAMEVEGALRNDIVAEMQRAEAADTVLDAKITAEVERSREKDDEHDAKISALESSAVTLQHSIENETTRAMSAETELSTLITSAGTKLDQEIVRSTNKDVEHDMNITNLSNSAQTLSDEINAEAAQREIQDTTIKALISAETTSREAKDTILETAINTEVTRSQAEDNRLNAALQQEIADRQEAISDVRESIEEATLTFEDTSSIDFTKTTGNKVTADVKLQEGDNIIKTGQGLYATAHLSYDTGTNKIKLTTTAGEEEYQLAGATVIDNLEYDSTNKELVITYHDGNGGVHTVRFGVSELFNEWSVQNPSENSAIELAKTPSATPGGEDKLSGRVLLTNLEDNAIQIVNNGLYVSAGDMEDAKEIAECVKNEVKVFEKAVIGHIIGEECGSGYTYEANNQAAYINSATSFNNADFILDQSIKNVENEVEEIKEDVECVDNKSDALYKMLYSNASPMPACGSGATYQPYIGACIISGATSFMEADQLLNDQICAILTMWVSGKTCSTESTWVDDGANRKMITDVRLSRGKYAEMTDDDVYITDLNGDYIDPTNHEFTDTNVLRIACIEEGPSGTTPSVDSMQNGIYLSNAWDCGLYYDEVEDEDAIEAANAAGYITAPYRTDTNASASNYNYMNNVRQHDI